MTIKIVVPAIEHGVVNECLRNITHALQKNGHGREQLLEGLGGRCGYGEYYENDVFKMTPFCWCGEENCPMCREEDPEPNFHHKASGLKVWWYKYIGRDMRIEGTKPAVDIFHECASSVKAKL